MAERILIIGGVAGGATAAAKARRENEGCEIHIFEQGGYVSYANCGLPYWLGGEIPSADDLLLMNPQLFWDKYRVKVHLNTVVTQIDPAKRTIVYDAQNQVASMSYDRLILCQGAKAILPPITGNQQSHVFFLKTVEDMFAIDAYLRSNPVDSAVIAGGGFIGLEVAEALMHRGLSVTIAELAPHVMPSMDLDFGLEFQKRIIESGLNIRSGVGVSTITSDEVILSDGSQIRAGLVVLAAGVRPETGLAQACGLEIGSSGGVVVDSRMQTSIKDIYCAGDMVEVEHLVSGRKVRMPLAGPANRQGRVAGANAAGGNLEFKKVLGTSIVRCMGQVAAATGLSLKQAQQLNWPQVTYSVTLDSNHAGYYPGAVPILTKLIYQKDTGLILGAQILGTEGVDRKIDVLAVAISAHMSVFDLESLDLAYSPPFGSANDPVNIAGFVAANGIRGVSDTVLPEELPTLAPYLILDVRESSEHSQTGLIPGSLACPLSSLRSTLHDLPKDRTLVTCCRKGQRGYIAERILRHHGFAVKNLAGGFLAAKRAGLVG